MFQSCCRGATDSERLEPSRLTARFTKSRLGCDDGRVPKRLTRSFFNRSVHEVAPDLIGVTLLVDGVGGRIVEVEAYHHTDPAAHSYGGQTPRNAVMFGPPGYVYVYRSYGIHWCVNFVCEPAGSASAVLIRAIEPTEGLPLMRRRRGLTDERLLCSGPGRLCEALRVTAAHNGLALDAPPFELFAARRRTVEIVAGVRASASPRRSTSRGAMARRARGFSASRFRRRPPCYTVSCAIAQSLILHELHL